MSKFEFRADAATLPFINLIIATMICRFSIARDEAIGRMNGLWRGQELLGEDDLIFHEDAEFWANTIYYGGNSMWQDPPSLKSLPYQI